MADPQLIKLRAAAKILGISVDVLRRKVKANDMPSIRLKPHGAFLIDRNDLCHFIDSHKSVAAVQ